MSLKQNNTECMINCLRIAAAAGLLVIVMLYWVADFGLIQAIFTGGLVGAVLGAILILTVCSSKSAADDLASEDKPAMRPAAQAEEGKATRLAAMDTGTADVAVASTADVGADAAGATAGTAGERTSVSANATSHATTVGGPEAGTISKDAVDTSAPAGNWTGVHSTTPSEVMDTPPVKKKSAPKAKAKAKPKAPAPAAAAKKPATMLSAARDGGADDLKLIGGVGPKLEGTLNELGVYHFDQVAKWTKKDIAWVDGNLRFKGRIERDDWMSQAKILAKGGETEFSRKKKKT